MLFLAKFGVQVGLLGSVGLSLQRIIFGDKNSRLIAVSSIFLVVFIIVRLFLLNAELAGGLAHGLDFSMFGWVWVPNQSQSYLYSVGALVLLLSTILNRNALFGVGAALIVCGVSFGGHTQGLDIPIVNSAVVSIHVAVAAFWVTAPLVLWPRDAVSHSRLINKMNRFSMIAIWLVPFLFVSGLWLVFVLSGSVGAMFSNDYGRLLLVKLMFAMAALAIGALNKYWISDKLVKDPIRARKLLRKFLLFDGVLFIGAVSAIAAATSLTGPNA